MSYALGFRNVHEVLAFLVSWPSFDNAAKLVVQRAAELNGDHYEILTASADALAAKHPLASTILLRAMIDFSLKNGRATRYRHAARHLSACASISAAITQFGAFETHDAYVTRLKAEHGRKSAFWDLANSSSGSSSRR